MDVKLEVTKKVIEALEKGGNVFSQMLINSAADGMPVNGVSGKEYRGTNVLMLWLAKDFFGYKSNTWLTYKQAQELGAQVRKGEKSTLCSYFDMKEKKQMSEAAEQGEEKGGYYMLCKPFFLFNLDQIDNLPANLTQADTPANTNNQPMVEIETFLNNCGAVVQEELSNKIYYHKGTDSIHIPNMDKFTSSDNYYLSLAHEIAHWTGAEHRLNRDMGKRFADKAYSLEELVAEFSACLIAGRFGMLDANLENHASYLQSWIDALKADKNIIFTASKMAFEAYDYMVALQDKQQEKEAA